MKKFTILVLSTLLFFGLTACSSDDKKSVGQESFDAFGELQKNIEDGEPYHYSYQDNDYDYEVTFDENGNYHYVEYTSEAWEIFVIDDVTTVYIDGVLYEDEETTTIAYESLMEYIDIDLSMLDQNSFASAYIEEGSIEETDNGYTVKGRYEDGGTYDAIISKDATHYEEHGVDGDGMTFTFIIDTKDVEEVSK